jgi:chaperonin GroES
MDWELLGDRVLVKTSEEVSVTPGGILLPDEARPKPQRGVAVAVGPGAPRQMSARDETWPMGVHVGDEVLFTRYAGASC